MFENFNIRKALLGAALIAAAIVGGQSQGIVVGINEIANSFSPPVTHKAAENGE